MKNLGNFNTSEVIYGKFTTYRPSTGAPFTLAGTPALSVYKDNSTTQTTTGVTLNVDFDSLTGLHHYTIDTSDAFYAAGSFFDIVITTGTVDSVSVVGTVVGSFTLEAAADAVVGAINTDVITAASLNADAVTEIQSGLATASALSTTDGKVDSILADTGELQTDWANGGRLDLILDARASQTSVDTIDGIVDDILVDTAAIPTVGAIADAVWDEAISGHTGTGSTGEALGAAGSAGDPWTTALPGAYGAGSAGQIIGDNINATISSRASQTSVDDLPTNAELATALAAADDAVLAAVSTVDTVVDAIKAKTDSLTFTVAGHVDANMLMIDGSADAATRLESGVSGNVSGVCDSGSSTTSIITSSLDPAAVVNDQFNGRILTFTEDTTTAALRGQATDITDSTSGGVLTVTALTSAPSSGDKFTVT